MGAAKGAALEVIQPGARVGPRRGPARSLCVRQIRPGQENVHVQQCPGLPAQC